MLIELYKTYNKVKKVFVRPELHFKCCKWSKSPFLPVWRRGPRIWLTKDICYFGDPRNYKAYELKNVLVKTGESIWEFNGEQRKIDHFDWTKHKLPNNYVWRSDIRKKLKKWHLSWIQPVYQLPIWLAFHITNLDLVWKTKYDDYRFEFPPQFSIVIFGWSFNWWLLAPKNDFGEYSPDHYWESILWYIDTNDIIKTDEKIGKWCTCVENETKKSFFALSLSYLKEPYRSILENVRKNKELVRISPKRRFEKILQKVNY